MTQQEQAEQEQAPQRADRPAAPGPALDKATRSGTAVTPARVVFPSPYLEPGQTVPAAYLAPPQPGKPSYGSPEARPLGARAPRSPRRDARDARSPAASERDPALASASQRFFAALADWILINVLSSLLFWSQLQQFQRLGQEALARYQNPDSAATQAAVDSLLRSSALEHAFEHLVVGLFVVALVYFWVQHAFGGATIGKRLTGIVLARDGAPGPVGLLPAGLRAVAYLAGPAAFMLLSQVSPTLCLIGVVAWLADGSCALLDRRGRSLHDKAARTVVLRRKAPGQRS